MSKYVKIQIEGVANWVMCPANSADVNQAMTQAWESGEVFGKTVHFDEVELTEEEYQNIPATNQPWWRDDGSVGGTPLA